MGRRIGLAAEAMPLRRVKVGGFTITERFIGMAPSSRGFEPGPIEPGERRSLTFTRAGTFPFHCTPHPFMRGLIVVR